MFAAAAAGQDICQVKSVCMFDAITMSIVQNRADSKNATQWLSSLH